jgi:hypothetical protein
MSAGNNTIMQWESNCRYSNEAVSEWFFRMHYEEVIKST